MKRRLSPGELANRRAQLEQDGDDEARFAQVAGNILGIDENTPFCSTCGQEHDVKDCPKYQAVTVQTFISICPQCKAQSTMFPAKCPYDGTEMLKTAEQTNREKKARAMADVLLEWKFLPSQIECMADQQWSEVARAAGQHPPRSQTTKDLVLRYVREALG